MASSAGRGDPALTPASRTPATPGDVVELVEGVESVEVVVDTDAVRAGRAVRARLEVGARVAGFVGDESADAEALAAFVADVIRGPTK